MTVLCIYRMGNPKNLPRRCEDLSSGYNTIQVEGVGGEGNQQIAYWYSTVDSSIKYSARLSSGC